MIFRYINNTVNYSLFYPKSSSFDLIPYSDADFAGCKSDRKNTSDTHFLRHSLVSWFNKSKTLYHYLQLKQNILLRVLHVHKFVNETNLVDYGITSTTSPIMCDNTSAINLSKNLILHLRIKHIDIRYLFLRDHAIKGVSL